MAKWRRTREYRLWRVAVIRRDKGCVICGSKKQRQAHHLFNGKHHPSLRFDASNGVVLCKFHHTLLHCDYKNSFREVCTKKDFKNFVQLLTKVEKHRIKEENSGKKV